MLALIKQGRYLPIYVFEDLLKLCQVCKRWHLHKILKHADMLISDLSQAIYSSDKQPSKFHSYNCNGILQFLLKSWLTSYWPIGYNINK